MTAKWTWLVYMAGDNNLESQGPIDLREMQRVGSSEDVNIIVQFDTERQRTMRYRVDKGRLTTLQSLRGVDCGDPRVLTEFLTWGTATFPAERYAVVLWNHGGGWLDDDVDYDENRALKPRAAARKHKAQRSLFRSTHETVKQLGAQQLIAIDCGAQDYLDNQELRAAFERANVKVDLLGFDACLMSMLEIAYEMRDTATCMVGSEETEPGAGWPYAEILAALTKTPSMPTTELAGLIVDEHTAWYRAGKGSKWDDCATQSAFALGPIAKLAEAVNALAVALTADMKTSRSILAVAVQGALAFDEPSYIDLGNFASRVKQEAGKASAIGKAAQKVLGLLKPSAGVVVNNGLWGDSVKDAMGVSMFFPTPKQLRNLAPLLASYDKLRFNVEHPGWRTMLASFAKALG
jgi:cysteine peptidase C11 family protein